jgi:hypothetical protein
LKLLSSWTVFFLFDVPEVEAISLSV